MCGAKMSTTSPNVTNVNKMRRNATSSFFVSSSIEFWATQPDYYEISIIRATGGSRMRVLLLSCQMVAEFCNISSFCFCFKKLLIMEINWVFYDVPHKLTQWRT